MPELIEEEVDRDNPNSNGTGAVDFGGSHVFALDSNNGPIALRLLAPASAPGEFQFIQRLPDGRVHLIWFGDTNFNYGLESSSNLWFWSELAQVGASNGVFEYFDATTTNLLQRFYRTRH